MRNLITLVTLSFVTLSFLDSSAQATLDQSIRSRSSAPPTMVEAGSYSEARAGTAKRARSGGDSAGGGSEVIGRFRSFARDILNDPEYVTLPSRDSLLIALESTIEVVKQLTDEDGVRDQHNDHIAYGYEGKIQLKEDFWLRSLDSGKPILHHIIHELYRAAGIVKEVDGKKVCLDDDYSVTIHKFHLDSMELHSRIYKHSKVGYFATYGQELPLPVEFQSFQGNGDGTVKIIEVNGGRAYIWGLSNNKFIWTSFENLKNIRSPFERAQLRFEAVRRRVQNLIICQEWAAGLFTYTENLPYQPISDRSKGIKLSLMDTINVSLLNQRFELCRATDALSEVGSDGQMFFDRLKQNNRGLPNGTDLDSDL